MTLYRGILFDLGGTLCEHQSPHSAASNLLTAAQRAGIEAPEQLVRARYRQIRTELELSYSERSFYFHRELVADSIEQLARSFGKSVDASWVADYCDSQRQSVTDELQLRADTLSTLKMLRTKMNHMAIVSNIDDDYFHPILERTGLAAYFDYCTSSEAAGSCKPDGRFFEHAVVLANMQPSELLFVGDSLLHDVVGANQFGMDVAWLADVDAAIPAKLQHLEPVPTYTITSLSELLNVVEI